MDRETAIIVVNRTPTEQLYRLRNTEVERVLEITSGQLDARHPRRELRDTLLQNVSDDEPSGYGNPAIWPVTESWAEYCAYWLRLAAMVERVEDIWT